MQVFAVWLAFVYPHVRVHRRISLMCSSLLPPHCLTCLVLYCKLAYTKILQNFCLILIKFKIWIFLYKKYFLQISFLLVKSYNKIIETREETLGLTAKNNILWRKNTTLLLLFWLSALSHRNGTRSKHIEDYFSRK